MTLSYGQYQLGDTGLVIGHNTDYIVSEADGVYEMPDPRFGNSTTLDAPRGDRDGDFPIRQSMSPRVLTFKLDVLIDNVLAANPTWDRTRAANYNLAQLSKKWSWTRFDSQALDLLFSKPWDGEDHFRIRKARVIKRSFPSTADVALGHATGAVMLRSKDPNIYHDSSGGQHSVTVDPAGPTTSVTVTNSGSGIIYPVIYYNGSGGSTGSEPTLTASNGDELDFATNFVDLSPMKLDVFDRSVLDSLGARRDLWLSLRSSWDGFIVDPGQSSTFTVTGTGTWTVTWTDCELSL